MDQLNALAPRTLLLGAGVLLLIDTFLPWQSVSIFSRNAWHGFWGVVLCLVVVALVAICVAQRVGVALPPGIPYGLVTLALGGLSLVFAVLKNLTDEVSAWGSYVGIALSALVALGAWRVFGESGEKLPAALGSHSTPSSDPDTIA
jgi:low temperature requirement protein LtrA